MACAPGCPVSALTFTIDTRAVASCCDRLVLFAAICVDEMSVCHVRLWVFSGHQGACYITRAAIDHLRLPLCL